MTQIHYTTLTDALCEATAELIPICFPDMPPSDQMTVHSLYGLAERFPQGAIIALDGNRVIGMGTGAFLNINPDELPPTEHDLLYTDGQNNHTPTGEYYYGTNMAVHPAYQGQGIAREIYRRRKSVAVEYNKRGFYAAAVIPGYVNHKHDLDIHAYVEKVVAGELFDPTLSVQMRNGFGVVRLIHQFFTFPRSNNWAALILWENEHYDDG